MTKQPQNIDTENILLEAKTLIDNLVMSAKLTGIFGAFRKQHFPDGYPGEPDELTDPGELTCCVNELMKFIIILLGNKEAK